MHSSALRLLLISTCPLALTPAAAQSTIPLPQTLTVTPSGVDLQTRTYRYTHDDIVIDNLRLVRNWTGWSKLEDVDQYNPVENGFVHNLRAAVTVQRVPRPEGGTFAQQDWLVGVHIGAKTQMFRRMWGTDNFFEANGGSKGEKLTWTGGNTYGQQVYTFTDRDGTAYVFGGGSLGGVGNAHHCDGVSCGYVTSVTRLDGYRMDFEYDTDTSQTPNYRRLRLVKDNRGAAVAFEYNGRKITKTCAINLSAQAFTAGSACPSGVPTSSYSYQTSSYTFTDPSAKTITYSLENQTGTKSITLGGQSNPWLTLTGQLAEYGMAVKRQDFADGSWTEFGYTSPYGTYTTAAGTVSFKVQGGLSYDSNTGNNFVVPAGGPDTVIDELGRTTTANYCVTAYNQCVAQQVPLSQTRPEGDQTLYEYDGLDNITKATFKAKSGSGLADRVMTAAYTYVGGVQAKPTTIVDARGAQSDFTYDNVHGGVLTETGPAPAVGQPRPQTRYGYVQRYAWIANWSGGYVQAATPIWLLDFKSLCKTSAATGNPSAPCAVAGDEVKTTYDYGPNSGPNNLLLRGIVEDAGGLSLRTCYGYDTQGRRISETKPKANLSSCP